jgi:hypothetical protein
VWVSRFVLIHVPSPGDFRRPIKKGSGRILLISTMQLAGLNPSPLAASRLAAATRPTPHFSARRATWPPPQPPPRHGESLGTEMAAVDSQIWLAVGG